MNPRLEITVVIVLYGRTASESEAYVSLQRIFTMNPEWQQIFRLLLYDNSPKSEAVHPDIAGVEYFHDETNGGLASAYNFALKLAVANRSEWLLLLDQDTTLTAEYTAKLLGAMHEHSAQPNVAAIVPILEMESTVYSPEADFFYHLRHQFPFMRNYPVLRGTSGLQARRINAYNSGAAIRVSALQQIKGFPVEFQVDYLDHAVFHLLQQGGFSVFILDTVLQQKLSHSDLNSVSLVRHVSVLQAQTLFVARYGKILDRMLFRLWLLRKARHYRGLCADARVWRGMVRQALWIWRLPTMEKTR